MFTFVNLLIISSYIAHAEDNLSYGQLTISSSPTGADVFLDGVKVGETPITKMKYPLGIHLLEIKKNKYHTVKQRIVIKKEDNFVRKVKLKPAFANLTINSTPPAATLILNGKEAGVTPWKTLEQSSGVYQIQLLREGYAPLKEQLVLKDGINASKHFKLKRISANIKLQSVPSGANVHRNGKLLGTTPLELAHQKPGSYRLVISKKDYFPKVLQFSLKANKDLQFTPRLTANHGTLVIDSKPQGAAILINDQDTGFFTPHTFLKQPSGEIQIRLKKKGHKSWKKNKLTVPGKGKSISIKGQLKPQYGHLRIRGMVSSSEFCSGTVWLNDRKVGRTPLTYKALAMRHDIKVECGNLGGSQTIQLSPLEQRKVDVLLQPLSLRKRLPHEKNIRRERGIDILLLSTASLMLGLTGKSALQMNRNYSEAAEIENEEQGDRYQKLVKAGDEAKNSMLITGGLTTLVAGAVFYHYWRTEQKSPPQQKSSQ